MGFLVGLGKFILVFSLCAQAQLFLNDETFPKIWKDKLISLQIFEEVSDEVSEMLRHFLYGSYMFALFSFIFDTSLVWAINIIGVVSYSYVFYPHNIKDNTNP